MTISRPLPFLIFAPLIFAATCGAALSPALAKDPDEITADAARAAERAADQASQAAERASQAAERAADQAARAAEQASRGGTAADRAEVRLREERARADADTAERSARSAVDGVRQQARLAEDAAKAQQVSAQHTASDAAKAQQDAAKDAADAAKDAAKEAADAAKDAADTARDAAEAAGDGSARAFAERAADGQGSSGSMHNLAADERPEFDSRGFPVRRGEIVGLDVSDAARAAALGQGFRVVAESRLPALDARLVRLRIPAGMTADAALARMRSLDSAGTYDFTHYYGLNIGTAGTADGTVMAAPTRRKGDLRIGMIDTAIAPHPLLRGIAVEARDFVGKGQRTDAAHGTAIASLLALAGTSRIVAANVFQGSGAGSFTSADAVAQGLEWLLVRQVNVINISLAGPSNAILDALVRRATQNGHAIVAAAGNGGPAAPPAFPAAVPGVVAVTAVDANLRIYRYANQGSYIAFAARGVAVPAAAPGGAISGYSGTSFATPLIAAHLARCARGKAASIGGCVHEMERTARDLGAPGRDVVYGHGYVSD